MVFERKAVDGRRQVVHGDRELGLGGVCGGGLADLDLDALRRASERIAGADRVFVCGALSGAILSDYLLYIASMSFADWYRIGN